MAAGGMIGSLIGAFGGRALGGMIGGRNGQMIGSLLGSMIGGRSGAGGLGGGGLGGLLGGLGGGQPNQGQQPPPPAMPDDEATILIRAMTNAAKADGTVDQSEIDAIVSRAGELDADDERFLRSEFAAPLNIDEFIASVPSGLEAEVYTASMLPITVDTIAETEYLRTLANGLGLSEGQVAEIHEALGV